MPIDIYDHLYHFEEVKHDPSRSDSFANDNHLGDYDGVNLKIRVRQDMHPRVKLVTVWHEIVHGLLDHLGVQGTHDELIVDNAAHVIVKTLGIPAQAPYFVTKDALPSAFTISVYDLPFVVQTSFFEGEMNCTYSMRNGEIMLHQHTNAAYRRILLWASTLILGLEIAGNSEGKNRAVGLATGIVWVLDHNPKLTEMTLLGGWNADFHERLATTDPAPAPAPPIQSRIARWNAARWSKWLDRQRE